MAGHLPTISYERYSFKHRGKMGRVTRCSVRISSWKLASGSIGGIGRSFRYFRILRSNSGYIQRVLSSFFSKELVDAPLTS